VICDERKSKAGFPFEAFEGGTDCRSESAHLVVEHIPKADLIFLLLFLGSADHGGCGARSTASHSCHKTVSLSLFLSFSLSLARSLRSQSIDLPAGVRAAACASDIYRPCTACSPTASVCCVCARARSKAPNSVGGDGGGGCVCLIFIVVASGYNIMYAAAAAAAAAGNTKVLFCRSAALSAFCTGENADFPLSLCAICTFVCKVHVLLRGQWAVLLNSQ
jgi:hypothetical protein